ncbi:hypothetical protein BpHYR1_041063, partial [Brachionus plicatilis]
KKSSIFSSLSDTHRYFYFISQFISFPKYSIFFDKFISRKSRSVHKVTKRETSHCPKSRLPAIDLSIRDRILVCGLSS